MSSEQTTLRGAPPSTQGALPPPVVPALTIACHPRPERIGQTARLPEMLLGGSISLSRLEPLFLCPTSRRSEALDDAYVSRKPLSLERAGENFVLRRGHSSTEVQVGGHDLGDVCTIAGTEVLHGAPIELAGRILLILHWVRAHRAKRVSEPLLGETMAICSVHDAIARLANENITVLVRGETGSGKELVAQALHAAGRRQSGPFVALNMGAIPASTASAELFGHRKGAFTGATDAQPGLFGRAHQGSLFLDEIGETPLDVQPLLLRALETGEIQSLGGGQPRRVDARVIAATDADLEAEIAQGHFRPALFHRLAAATIGLAPLRDRKPDIPLLFWSFVRDSLASEAPWEKLDPRGNEVWLKPQYVRQLLDRPWHGNVRELKHFASQVAIASRGHARVRWPKETEALEAATMRVAPSTSEAARTGGRTNLDSISETQLATALRDNEWRIGATALALGISKTSLYQLIERSPSIRKARDLTEEEIERVRGECDNEARPMARTLEVSKRALVLRIKELGLRAAK